MNRTTWSVQADGRQQVVIAIDRVAPFLPDIPCVDEWASEARQVTATFHPDAAIDFRVMRDILVYLGQRGCFIGEARDNLTHAFWRPLY